MPWAILPDNTAVRVEAVAHMFVELNNDDGKWYVRATLFSGETLTVSDGFTTKTLAQNRAMAIIGATGGTL